MMLICTKELENRLDLYIDVILNGNQHHSQFLLTIPSSISSKLVKERDENHVWALLSTE